MASKNSENRKTKRTFQNILAFMYTWLRGDAELLNDNTSIYIRRKMSKQNFPWGIRRRFFNQYSLRYLYRKERQGINH